MPKRPELHVWGGGIIIRGETLRVVMAASSRAEVARAARCSSHYIKEFWCITHNEHEVAAAMARPGVLLTAKRYQNKTHFEPVSFK